MIVAGFGCTSRAGPASLRALIARMAQHAGLDALACLEGRADMLGPLARIAGLPLIAIPVQAIDGIATPTQSARVLAAFGTGSVAEACALVAAASGAEGNDTRAGAQIMVARIVSQDRQATCALARRVLQ
ncbi:cobalamin biosynthesis protein [Roseinatronobacter sp. S2]|uniref:cobalamin biosynthesis protein n=1 Tax=Roseinatronobacter sp. S2 TaxID=3035471 RepID=UPI00240EE5FF|nr:cobalamin biosynthesis protein [Roseinatronobacter sp. S2]WFE73859.1 cobalamin biosynthesis protein [Roseinatronobacter sp. S2]